MNGEVCGPSDIRLRLKAEASQELDRRSIRWNGRLTGQRVSTMLRRFASRSGFPACADSLLF